MGCEDLFPASLTHHLFLFFLSKPYTAPLPFSFFLSTSWCKYCWARSQHLLNFQGPFDKLGNWFYLFFWNPTKRKKRNEPSQYFIAILHWILTLRHDKHTLWEQGKNLGFRVSLSYWNAHWVQVIKFLSSIIALAIFQSRMESKNCFIRMITWFVSDLRSTDLLNVWNNTDGRVDFL